MLRGTSHATGPSYNGGQDLTLRGTLSSFPLSLVLAQAGAGLAPREGPPAHPFPTLTYRFLPLKAKQPHARLTPHPEPLRSPSSFRCYVPELSSWPGGQREQEGLAWRVLSHCLQLTEGSV